jgi:hypothetical protein
VDGLVATPGAWPVVRFVGREAILATISRHPAGGPPHAFPKRQGRHRGTGFDAEPAFGTSCQVFQPDDLFQLFGSTVTGKERRTGIFGRRLQLGCGKGIGHRKRVGRIAHGFQIGFVQVPYPPTLRRVAIRTMQRVIGRFGPPCRYASTILGPPCCCLLGGGRTGAKRFSSNGGTVSEHEVIFVFVVRNTLTNIQYNDAPRKMQTMPMDYA